MMRRPATNETKKAWLRGLLAATVMALIAICSTGISAASTVQTWSVYVHIEYPDGFVYEHAFAVGVPTSELPSILSACASAHAGGSAVRYHCFPQPE